MRIRRCWFVGEQVFVRRIHRLVIYILVILSGSKLRILVLKLLGIKLITIVNIKKFLLKRNIDLFARTSENHVFKCNVQNINNTSELF